MLQPLVTGSMLSVKVKRNVFCFLFVVGREHVLYIFPKARIYRGHYLSLRIRIEPAE